MTATIADQFVHPALLYRGADEYLAGTVPYIRAGLAAGEPVAVAVPGPNLSLLQDALGADAERVLLRDMTEAGRNPGRIIPTVLLAFADAHPGQRVRIIGEPVWAGRTPLEYPACAQHEALINTAFTGRAATILCPYDTASLDPAWIEDAHRTHPVVFTADGSFDSPHYADPVAVAAGFNHPLPAPPAGAATTTVDLHSLQEARRFVAEHAARAGMTAARVPYLTLAVNELTANAVEHGGGTAELTVWAQDGDVVCQLTDRGRLTDPLVGRVPVPPDGPTKGRGLLLVNQLSDLVRMHTGPSGTTIRIHLHH